MKKAHRVSRFSRMKTVLVFYSAALIAIILITCVSTYLFCLRFITNQTIEAQSILMEDGMIELQSSLRNLDTYITTLGATDEAVSLLKMSAQPSSTLVSQISQFHNEHPVLEDQTGIIRDTTDIWLWSESNQAFVNSVTAYFSADAWYGSWLSGSVVSLQKLESLLEERQTGNVYLAVHYNGQPAVLTIRRVYRNARNVGKALCFLNTQKLVEVMTQRTVSGLPMDIVMFSDYEDVFYTSLPSEEAAALVEREGVFSGWHAATVSSDKSVIFQVDLESYGFHVYYIIPQSWFNSHSFQSSISILKYMLPMLLIGIILLCVAFHFSHFYLYDTIRIIGTSHMKPDTINPFKYIQQSTSALSMMNAEQQSRLNTSFAETRDAVLTTLIYSESDRISTLQDKFLEYSIPLEADVYRGLILYLTAPNSDELLEITGMEHMTILNVFNCAAQDIRYLKMDGPCRMLFVYCSDSTPDHEQRLINLLNGLCSTVMESIKQQVHIIGGRETCRLEGLPRSFKAARDHECAGIPDASPVVLCQHEARQHMYDYSDKDSRALQHMAARADYSGITAALEDIRYRNENTLHLSDFNRQMLYAHMLSTLLKAGYTHELGDELREHFAELPSERFFALLSACYERLCSDNAATKQQQQQQMAESILLSFQEHVKDYAFSIADLAMEYGCSERQMQQMVQNAAGMSFSAYLEQCRIQKSAELLRDPALKIEDVALRVGYASDKSFRRAFKRVTGSLPSEYRE